MSFSGSCIAQAVQITSQDGRLSAVESVAASKVAQSVYDAKIALVDAKDAAQDGRLVAVEAKDVEQDARLVAVEGRASALESDIAGRVEAEINAKVAQGVFDSLASELRSADSALTAALATKVAATTQSAVDALQNSAIATKASIAQFNGLINAVNGELDRLDAKDVEHDGRLSQIESNVDNHEQAISNNILPNLSDLNGWRGDIEGRVGSSEGVISSVILPNLSDLNSWRGATSGRVSAVETRLNVQVDPHLVAIDGKLAALEEFVRVLLQTYVITKPAGGSYVYTGAAQSLL